MAKLNREEMEFLESFNRKEWKPVDDQETEAARYGKYASDTFKRDLRVTIRISRGDLEFIKLRALEEGIPYRTLMGSILHKYVNGRLVDKGSAARPKARAAGR